LVLIEGDYLVCSKKDGFVEGKTETGGLAVVWLKDDLVVN
jgi:hypothetical protein